MVYIAVSYLLVLIIGLVIGSFLNVCIYRIPKGESIVMPPSHCTNCGNRLRPVDLVPVLSYLLLGGKCRYCKEEVSFRYPLVELITGLAFVLLYFKYGPTVDFLAFAFMTSILIAVFFIDLDHYIIPDGLVLTALAGGVAIAAYNAFHPLEIYGDAKWWNPLVGMLTGSGFLFLVALVGMLVYKTDEAMGMGDVKIFAPIGIFLGWRMTLLALLVSVVLGGVISLILILANKRNRKDAIPFGPFIVTATFVVMLWGWEILRWYIGRLSA